jgi:hypothetical protein
MAPIAVPAVLLLGSVAVGRERTFGLILLMVALSLILGWRLRDIRRSMKRAAAEMIAIPGPGSGVDEALQFGRLTYRGDSRHRLDELAWLAATARAHWNETGHAPDSAQVARAALYFESTQHGVGPSAPASESDDAYVRALLARIRLFAPDGRLAPDKPGPLLTMRRWAAGVGGTRT